MTWWSVEVAPGYMRGQSVLASCPEERCLPELEGSFVLGIESNAWHQMNPPMAPIPETWRSVLVKWSQLHEKEQGIQILRLSLNVDSWLINPLQLNEHPSHMGGLLIKSLHYCVLSQWDMPLPLGTSEQKLTWIEIQSESILLVMLPVEHGGFLNVTEEDGWRVLRVETPL